MSIKNVEKFLNLAKSNEKLQKELILINEKLQKEEGNEEKIIADNVVPLAKKNGIIFTADDFLQYANEQVSALSEEDLLNVSGGISARNTAAALLVTFLGSLGVGAAVNLLNLPQEDNKSVVRKAEKNNGEDSRNNQDEINSDVQSDVDKILKADQKTDVAEENNNENEAQAGGNIAQSNNESSKTNDAEQKNRRDVMQNKNVVLPSNNAKNTPAAPRINVTPQANAANTSVKNTATTTALGAVEPAEHAEHVGGYEVAVAGSEKNTAKPVVRQEKKVTFAPEVKKETTAKKDDDVKPASKTIDKPEAKAKQDEGAKLVTPVADEDTSKKSVTPTEESKESAKILDSGECGVNAKWSWDAAGTFTISGTGELQEYAYDEEPFPDEIKYSVKRIIIEEGITSLKNFFVFPFVASIDISSSLTELNADYFKACHQLESINVDENNTEYKSIDGVLFSKDGTKLLCYPGGKTDPSYTIPAGVNSIDKGAFFVSHLNNLIIPNSVSEIGENAFNSSRIKSIVFLGDNEPNFGEHASGINNSTQVFVFNDYSGATFDGIAVTKVEDINAKSAEFFNTGAVGAAEHVEHVGGGITDYSSWHFWIWNDTVTNQANHLINFLRSLPKTEDGLPDLNYVSEETHEVLGYDIIHVAKQLRTQINDYNEKEIIMQGEINPDQKIARENADMLLTLARNILTSQRVTPALVLEAIEENILPSDKTKGLPDLLGPKEEERKIDLPDLERSDAQLISDAVKTAIINLSDEQIYSGELSISDERKLANLKLRLINSNAPSDSNAENSTEHVEVDGQLEKVVSANNVGGQEDGINIKNINATWKDLTTYKEEKVGEDGKVEIKVKTRKGFEGQTPMSYLKDKLPKAEDGLPDIGKIKDPDILEFYKQLINEVGRKISADDGIYCTDQELVDSLGLNDDADIRMMLNLYYKQNNDALEFLKSLPQKENGSADLSKGDPKLVDKLVPAINLVGEQIVYDEEFGQYKFVGEKLKKGWLFGGINLVKKTEYTKIFNLSQDDLKLLYETREALPQEQKVSFVKIINDLPKTAENLPDLNKADPTTAIYLRLDVLSLSKQITQNMDGSYSVSDEAKTRFNLTDDDVKTIKILGDRQAEIEKRDKRKQTAIGVAQGVVLVGATLLPAYLLGISPAFLGAAASKEPTEEELEKIFSEGQEALQTSPNTLETEGFESPSTHDQLVDPGTPVNDNYGKTMSDTMRVLKANGEDAEMAQRLSRIHQESADELNNMTSPVPQDQIGDNAQPEPLGKMWENSLGQSPVSEQNIDSNGKTSTTEGVLPLSPNTLKVEGFDSLGKTLSETIPEHQKMSTNLLNNNFNPGGQTPSEIIPEHQKMSTNLLNANNFNSRGQTPAEEPPINVANEVIDNQVDSSKRIDSRFLTPSNPEKVEISNGTVDLPKAGLPKAEAPKSTASGIQSNYSIKNNSYGEIIPGDEAITKDSNISRLNIEKPFEGKFYKAPSDNAPGPGEGAILPNASENSKIMQPSTFNPNAGSGNDGALQINQINDIKTLKPVEGTDNFNLKIYPTLNANGNNGPNNKGNNDITTPTGVNPNIKPEITPVAKPPVNVDGLGIKIEPTKNTAAKEPKSTPQIDYTVKGAEKLDNAAAEKLQNPRIELNSVEAPTAHEYVPEELDDIYRASAKDIENIGKSNLTPAETPKESANAAKIFNEYTSTGSTPVDAPHGPENIKTPSDLPPMTPEEVKKSLPKPVSKSEEFGTTSNTTPVDAPHGPENIKTPSDLPPMTPEEVKKSLPKPVSNSEEFGTNSISDLPPTPEEVQKILDQTVPTTEKINTNRGKGLDIDRGSTISSDPVDDEFLKIDRTNPPGKGEIAISNRQNKLKTQPSSFDRNAADEKNKAMPVVKNENFFTKWYNKLFPRSEAKNDATSSFVPVENNNVENSNNTPPKAQPGPTPIPLAQGSTEGEGAGTTWKDTLKSVTDKGASVAKSVYNSLPSKEQIGDGVGKVVDKGASAVKSVYNNLPSGEQVGAKLDEAKAAVKDLSKVNSLEGFTEYASEHPNVAKAAENMYIAGGVIAAGAVAGKVASKMANMLSADNDDAAQHPDNGGNLPSGGVDNSSEESPGNVKALVDYLNKLPKIDINGTKLPDLTAVPGENLINLKEYIFDAGENIDPQNKRIIDEAKFINANKVTPEDLKMLERLHFLLWFSTPKCLVNEILDGNVDKDGVPELGDGDNDLFKLGIAKVADKVTKENGTGKYIISESVWDYTDAQLSANSPDIVSCELSQDNIEKILAIRRKYNLNVDDFIKKADDEAPAPAPDGGGDHGGPDGGLGGMPPAAPAPAPVPAPEPAPAQPEAEEQLVSLKEVNAFIGSTKNKYLPGDSNYEPNDKDKLTEEEEKFILKFCKANKIDTNSPDPRCWIKDDNGHKVQYTGKTKSSDTGKVGNCQVRSRKSMLRTKFLHLFVNAHVKAVQEKYAPKPPKKDV